MFRMHAVFPAAEGSGINWEVYVDEHLPLAREKLTPHGLTRISAQKCAQGPDGNEPANAMIVTLEFESQDKFNAAFAEEAPGLIAHVAKFTDIKPIFHFGEVVE